MSNSIRPYQQSTFEECQRLARLGFRRIVVVIPTGGGKTIVALLLKQAAAAKGSRTLFLADRRDLVNQASQRAREWGVDHGILMDGHETDLTKLVQIGSKDTIYSRCIQRGRYTMPSFSLIVVDEAHRGLNKSVVSIIDACGNPFTIGITATPAGPAGRGLGPKSPDEFGYQRMVIGATYKQLHAEGYLVPSIVFAPTLADRGKIRKGIDGEFIQVEADAAMRKPKLVGDVVKKWIEWGEMRRTVVFAQSVDHSIDLVKKFNKAGFQFRHIDAHTPDHERTEIYDELWSGYIHGISNYGVLDTGWDCPPCSCCIVARVEGTRTGWMQKAGRVGRPWDGTNKDGRQIAEPKTNAILIDHGGNVWDHGYPDEDIPWDLNPSKKIDEIVTDWRASNEVQRDPIACPRCQRYREKGDTCPHCGFKVERRGKQSDWVDGDLGFVQRGIEAKLVESKDLQKIWGKWLGVMANKHKGGTIKAAAYMFMKTTGRKITACEGVKPMPHDHEFEMNVSVVYPGFVRRKKSAATA